MPDFLFTVIYHYLLNISFNATYDCSNPTSRNTIFFVNFSKKVYRTLLTVPNHLKWSNKSYFNVFKDKKVRNCQRFVEKSVKMCVQRRRKRIHSERLLKDTMDPVYQMQFSNDIFIVMNDFLVRNVVFTLFQHNLGESVH